MFTERSYNKNKKDIAVQSSLQIFDARCTENYLSYLHQILTKKIQD